MPKNEFLVKRMAHASFVMPSNAAASTHYPVSNVYIPVGAIITGISIFSPDALTITNASHTVVPRIGTASLCATVNVSDLPAQTVMASTAVTSALGYLVTAGGMLNLACSACTTAVTATYDFYIDYLYVVD